MYNGCEVREVIEIVVIPASGLAVRKPIVAAIGLVMRLVIVIVIGKEIIEPISNYDTHFSVVTGM